LLWRYCTRLGWIYCSTTTWYWDQCTFLVGWLGSFFTGDDLFYVISSKWENFLNNSSFLYWIVECRELESAFNSNHHHLYHCPLVRCQSTYHHSLSLSRFPPRNFFVFRMYSINMFVSFRNLHVSTSSSPFSMFFWIYLLWYLVHFMWTVSTIKTFFLREWKVSWKASLILLHRSFDSIFFW
jgi:hypothetical protein